MTLAAAPVEAMIKPSDARVADVVGQTRTVIMAVGELAGVFGAMKREEQQVAAQLGTVVRPYERTSTRTPGTPRWASVSSSFPLARRTPEQQAGETIDAEPPVDTPDWAKPVLTKEQRRRLKAAHKAGTVLNLLPELSGGQLDKITRATARQNRQKERARLVNEGIQHDVKLAHERRKRASGYQPAGVSALDSYLYRPIM